MGESLFGVSIPPEALSESEPGRQAGDKGPQRVFVDYADLGVWWYGIKVYLVNFIGTKYLAVRYCAVAHR